MVDYLGRNLPGWGRGRMLSPSRLRPRLPAPIRRGRSAGEVPERSIGAVSKTVVPLAGTEGSNPSLSANVPAYCIDKLGTFSIQTFQHTPWHALSRWCFSKFLIRSLVAHTVPACSVPPLTSLSIGP